jgi:class 3 adenylate cyclase
MIPGGSRNPFRRPCLLLVDDTPANIDVLVGLLKADFDLKVATTGARALQICDSDQQIDLILLDVMMPEMDGFEACRRLKASEKRSKVPVIFLTARTDVADIVRGFEMGAVDYVAKPFNSHELLARVNTHLALDRLHRDNERLLLNILPVSIADRLKSGEGRIADYFPEVSVLFADLVGFTALSGNIPPQPLVEMLNSLFTQFDGLAHEHKVEKIKTIGDCYMAVCGLPERRPDHAARMAGMALGMLDCLKNFNTGQETTLQIRIGLNTGPVVAGVIGSSKFIYDLWGDTVNTASRMESSGAPGRVHVSESTREALRDQFDFEERGEIEVKGKGRLKTWFLLGPNGAAQVSRKDAEAQ